jgi:rhomboid protease GluP
MNDFIIKFKLIYTRFLLITVGCLVIYSFLTWLFIYHFSLLDLNETLIKFGLPFCLPVIPIFIWLRPRIKLLALKTKTGDLPGLYYFISWIAIAVPVLLGQEYLSTASGELTVLKSITEFNSKPITKYYELSKHFIDKRHATVYRKAEAGGKNNEYLTFYIYVACPVLKDTLNVDTFNYYKSLNPIAWLGTKYSKQISNGESDAYKEQVYKNFGTKSQNEFNVADLDKFVYLDHIGNNDQRKGYISAIKTAYRIADNKPVVFEAKNEPFEARTGKSFSWIFKSFGIGAAVWLLMLVFPKLNTKELKKLSEPVVPLNKQYYIKSTWANFKNSNVQVTLILTALNFIVFIVMVFAGLGFVSFDGSDLFDWGANYRPAVTDGQWWRLISSMFLHGGLMHLLMNMYGLIFVGIFLEPIIGKLKYSMAYMFCGVLASVASMWWHPATVAVGASGAIFGLYGVLTALLTTKKADASSKRFLLINNAIFIGINLLLGIRGGIDNAAHIGGLLSGIIAGYVLYFFIDAPKPKRKYKRKTKVTEQENVTDANVD